MKSSKSVMDEMKYECKMYTQNVNMQTFINVVRGCNRGQFYSYYTCISVTVVCRPDSSTVHSKHVATVFTHCQITVSLNCEIALSSYNG